MDSDRTVSDMPWAVSRRRQDPGWALSTSPLVISSAATITLLDDSEVVGLFHEDFDILAKGVETPPD